MANLGTRLYTNKRRATKGDRVQTHFKNFETACKSLASAKTPDARRKAVQMGASAALAIKKATGRYPEGSDQFADKTLF